MGKIRCFASDGGEKHRLIMRQSGRDPSMARLHLFRMRWKLGLALTPAAACRGPRTPDGYPMAWTEPTLWAWIFFFSEWAIRLAMLVVIPFRRTPVAAKGWLLLIFFEPWVGLLVYFLLGRANSALAAGTTRQDPGGDVQSRRAAHQPPQYVSPRGRSGFVASGNSCRKPGSYAYPGWKCR